MSVFNFPPNPSINDEYTGPNGVVYIWDGVRWLGNAEPISQASSSVSGVVQLAVASEYPSLLDDEATTPAYVKTAIDTAFANAPISNMQKNAQGFYVHTDEAGTATVIQPGDFISSDAGQSLNVGSDGKVFVNVIGLLPPDSTYSGSNNGNVDISFTPDITDPTLVTAEANLDVAAQTPTATTNMLKESASGFYVSTEEIVAAAPDASATARGLVNLTDLQALGAGRKNIDGVTVGRGNPGNASRSTVTAIGTNAGISNTQGETTFIGFNAGLGNTGFGATSIGNRAGVSNTGSDTVHIGLYAGNTNSGARSTGIGSGSGQYNSAADSTAIGFSSGAVNRGLASTAIGALAGRINNGERTTFIGRNSGYYNNGNNVTVVGADAGFSATTTIHDITRTGTTGTITPAVAATAINRNYQIILTDQRVILVRFTSTTTFAVVDAGTVTDGSYTNVSLFHGEEFTNVTVLGALAQATKDNQVVLGDGNVTEVFTAGNHVADNYIGRVNTSGTINIGEAELFSRTIAAATTFTFTGAAPNLVYSFVMELTNAGAFAVTWPTGTKWEGGTPPVLTSSGIDILGFYTRDGGATYHGVLLSKDSK